MAFCKLSNESTKSSKTIIDNKFFEHFLPYAPESCIKVYLLGLYRCTTPNTENTLDNFAKTLNMTEEDVESCFLYWQEQGLVTILNIKPFEVIYLPVTTKNAYLKKVNSSKYKDFNVQIQEIICGRMITPTEYAEYYTLIESMHIEPTALLMIAKYCTNLKGNDIGYSYINTIAKNWAYKGIKTASQVEEQLKEHEAINSYINDILKLLGSKKQADFNDKQQYLYWKDELEYSNDVIEYVAKSFKKKGNIEKLDNKLNKYYELKLFSIKEIEDYEAEKQQLFDTAKQVTKAIGVYYENLENVIETYILMWINKGYNAQTLKQIANFCFKNNIKTLEGMNNTVDKFYIQGLTTVDSIENYFGEIIEVDNKIKKILKNIGLSRNVNTWDRDFYRTWTYVWNFSDEIIEYASTLAVNKTHPLAYINKILSDWFKNNINTLEKAKQQKVVVENTTQNKHDFKQRSYSPEQINALFDNLNEVKWK